MVGFDIKIDNLLVIIAVMSRSEFGINEVAGYQ